MGEGLEQMYSEVMAPSSSSSSSSRAEDEDELGESSSLSGDSSDDEQVKAHDAASSSSDSHALLHELSSLVSQLPNKRGLSKFYQGKSQSLSSFSDLRSVEDLAKKETPIKRKMKPARSYAGGLDGEAQNNSYYGPSSGPCNNNMVVPKRGPRGSCASSIARTTSGSSYFASGKPPPIPTHNKNV